MWDTAETSGPGRLSHAVPCTRCGHESHDVLPCSDECDCEPPLLPWLPARWTAA